MELILVCGTAHYVCSTTRCKARQLRLQLQEPLICLKLVPRSKLVVGLSWTATASRTKGN